MKLKKDEAILKMMTTELEYKTKTAVGISRFLTHKIIRQEEIEKPMNDEGHEASYTTLKNNEVSSKMLTNVFTRRTDAFFRFVVVGRTDCLLTLANLQRWFEDRRDENCRRCGPHQKSTLAHILNACTPNYPLMTKRHNRLANVVRKAVIKFIGKDLRSNITENSQMEEEELSEELQRLPPDIVFKRRERNGSRNGSRNRNKHRQGHRNEKGNGDRNRNESQEQQNETEAEAAARTGAGMGEEEGGREAEADSPNTSEGSRRSEKKMMEVLEFSCPHGHNSHG
jgi:hypothetical protein